MAWHGMRLTIMLSITVDMDDEEFKKTTTIIQSGFT